MACSSQQYRGVGKGSGTSVLDPALLVAGVSTVILIQVNILICSEAIYYLCVVYDKEKQTIKNFCLKLATSEMVVS